MRNNCTKFASPLRFGKHKLFYLFFGSFWVCKGRRATKLWSPLFEVGRREKGLFRRCSS